MYYAPVPDLHISTLSAVLALVQFAAVVFSVFLYVAHQTFHGARLWILGQACMAVGALALGLRNVLPMVPALYLTNISYIAAGVLLLHSLWAFRFRRPFPWLIYLIIAVAGGLLAVDMSEDVRFRSILFSAVIALVNLGIAIVAVYRQPKVYRLPGYLLGVTFFIIAAANLARIPDFLRESPVRFDEQPRISAFVYFLSVLSPILVLFGYYLLSGTRAEAERLARESQLQQRNIELSKLNKMATTLLSVIAHDVKTPITAAYRYVSRFLVAAPESLEQKRSELHVLETTLEYSRRLLENLVTYARTQIGGGHRASTGVVSVREVIRLTVDYVKPTAQRKGVSVRIVPPEAERLVCGAEELLSIVFRNLLQNAIKFSHPEGVVTVSCRETEDRTEVTIRDEGVGMPPEVLAQIMDTEVITSTLGTAGERGSGIGLALVRALCAQLDIEFDIQSIQDQGTSVLLNLRGAGEDPGCVSDLEEV